MQFDSTPSTRVAGAASKRRLSLKPSTKTVLGFIVVLLALVGWFSVSAFASVLKIIDSPSDSASPALKHFGQQVNPDEVAGEGDGRINVLFMGVGGAGHAGGQLADTIMLVSLDPKNDNLALLSVPRDLRVPIPGYGFNKINAAQSLGEQSKKGDGPKLMKETVSAVLDVPIHYYVKADFVGFQQFVDKIGGVTINVPKAINDPLYPDDKTDGYKPFYLKAGTTTMNGDIALRYARSRETTSDFDRAARQQLLLVAMKDKVLSAGIIGNPKKLTELLTILGNHVRTDLAVNDLDRLTSLAKDIHGAQIVSDVIDNSADGPLMSTNDGGYYLVPKRGATDFRDVQRIAHHLFGDPYVAQEKATVQLVNATGRASETKDLQLDLESLGYTVVSSVEAAPTPTTTIVDSTRGGKPFSLKFLTQRFTATLQTGSSKTPSGSTSDIVLTVGQDFLKVAKAKK